MKRILMPALTLAAMTTAAAAEPQAMSEDQLAGIAGGATGVVQNIAQWQQAHGLALDLSPFGGAADMGIDAGVDIDQGQDAANDSAGAASVAQWQRADGLALSLSPFGGAADVGINQRQNVANDAMAPVLIVPGMSDATPALPGGEVGFGANFNSSQSFN